MVSYKIYLLKKNVPIVLINSFNPIEIHYFLLFHRQYMGYIMKNVLFFEAKRLLTQFLDCENLYINTLINNFS